jgi:hypothetical protein
LPDVVREGDAAREEREEREQQRALLSSIPSYVPDKGWVVMELPDSIPCQGVPEICKASDKFLRKKEVACKFMDGWQRGTVHQLETSEQRGSKGFFSIKIKNVYGWPLYDLNKESYNKNWVVLVKQSDKD